MAADQYREQTFHAFEMTPDKTAAPTAGTRRATTLKGAHYDYFEYGDAADMAAYCQWMVPEDFDDTAGTFSVAVYWETDTLVATEGVNWDVELVGRADGEDINVVFSTAFAEFESLADGGAARDLNINRATLAGTTGLTKGDLMVLSARRDVDGTHDDLTDTARLIKVVIQYHTLGASNLQWTTGTAPGAGQTYRERYFPASKFVGDVDEPPAAGTRQATSLQAAHYPYLAFNDAVESSAYTTWVVPIDCDQTAGTMYMRIYWESVGISGACRWELGAKGRSDGEDINVSIGRTPLSRTSAGSARHLNISDTLIATLQSQTSVGELVALLVRRVGTYGGESLTDPANFIGLGIQWLADEDGANAQWT